MAKQFTYANADESMDSATREVVNALRGRFDGTTPKEKGYTPEDLAIAFYSTMGLSGDKIPRALVFVDDSIDMAVQKIEGMLQGNRNSLVKPKMRDDLSALNDLLNGQGHSGFSASFCAGKVLLNITGKESAKMYVDEGREHIQYATKIREGLVEQFGSREFAELRSTHPEFYNLITRIEGKAAEIYSREDVAQEHNPGVASQTVSRRVRSVFLNGLSDGIAKERNKLAEEMRDRSVRDLDRDGVVVLPIIAKEDGRAGTMLTDTARKGVEDSQMYVEIVGDGFGDTSLNMANVAYKTARNTGTPSLILAKNRRKANNPNFAEDFLESVDPGLVRNYTNVHDARSQFSDMYERVFNGTVPFTEKQEEWRRARAEILADYEKGLKSK